ncbi:MAG: hypothetical protein U1F71_18185 [Verrucomicrobiaceae bacterium]
MKSTLLLLSVSLSVLPLSSCVVEGQGHVHAQGYRPGHYYSHTNEHYHYRQPPPKRSSGGLLNANTNVHLGL